MSIVFVKGDLFQHAGLHALAHGCNCAGAMGKGIALQFRARFPAMYAAYKDRCADGRFGLGEVFVWREGAMVIFNLGTQRTWRAKAELSVVATAVRTMVRLAEEARIARVGLPRIGAGLGGLPWDAVRAMLVEIGAATAVELVVFEEYQEG